MRAVLMTAGAAAATAFALARTSVATPGSVVQSSPQQSAACRPDNAGLSAAPGFCVLIVADSLGTPRHIAVAPNGDIFVAIRRGPGVLALRDTNRDGIADVRAQFGSGGTSGLVLTDRHLYYSSNTAVMRYAWQAGQLHPSGQPDTIVSGLPGDRSHREKSIAIGTGNALYVNIGSPTNSCQTTDRTEKSPGRDPCDDLETRGGIWRFDATRTGQTQADGVRFATGMRNTIALGIRPQDGRVYAAVHGRDQLSASWGFTNEQNAEKPSEIFVRVDQGDDYGWPYCYHDPELNQQVLAPEYGGDGRQLGRCEQVKEPLMGFPGHWAPNAVFFYSGSQFPAKYRGGAFIAFHGSWNRAPLPQAGFNVVFVPFSGDRPVGGYEIFLDKFRGDDGVVRRPTGLAQGPDGSLYVTDDGSGRIYRVMYRGADR